MSTSQKLWAALTLLFLVIIITGGIIIWSRLKPAPPLEIRLNPQPQYLGTVAVTGAVHSPALYPLKAGDTLSDLLQAAGGMTDRAASSSIVLHVPERNEQLLPQKIDINCAEAWLLEALPDIGETRARAIVDYRTRNGMFASITDLTKVEGISANTLEKIREFITVAE